MSQPEWYSMQLGRLANGTKLAQMIEAGSGNRVALISESKGRIQDDFQITSRRRKLDEM